MVIVVYTFTVTRVKKYSVMSEANIILSYSGEHILLFNKNVLILDLAIAGAQQSSFLTCWKCGSMWSSVMF